MIVLAFYKKMVYVLILRDHLFKTIISIQVVKPKKNKSDCVTKLP